MKPPRDHTIDVRGLKIHYLEWGERDGTPLILIHGFLDHARSWESFAKSVQSKSEKPLWMIAPDCRGHGDSGWIGVGGYYHFPDYVYDLDCLIHALRVSSVILMGHSMGGTISFLYTGSFPERVKKLILVEGMGPQGMNFSDAPPRMEKWISQSRAVRQRKSIEYLTLEQGAQRLRRTNPRLGSEQALDLARWAMRETKSGKWVWKFDPLHRTTSPQPFYSKQAFEFFRRIQCPVLIVKGKESRRSPCPDMQQRLERVAHRTLVEVKDGGHMIHHDNPEGLAAVVEKFLAV